MPIKILCPRCKRPLSVPRKMADSYTTCPICKGRLWVPAQDENGSSSDDMETPTPTRSNSATGPPAVASPPPPVNEAVPAKKVARFVTAKPVESTLDIAEDGKLPDLLLAEGRKAKAKDQSSTGINPLVLFGLICLSLVMSLVLVLVDPAPRGSSNSANKEAARQLIEKDYFADSEHIHSPNPPPLKPYQIYLRDAQRAHSRGDYETERKLYRKILALLRSERREGDWITGTGKRDRDLGDYLTTLLRTD